MLVQIGRTQQVPIYEETSVTVRDLKLSTLSNYFTVTDSGSRYWTKDDVFNGGISLVPGNVYTYSGTSTITLEAVRDLNNFRMWGRYYTPSTGQITITVAGETILNAVSGKYGPSDPTSGSAGYPEIVSERPLSAGDKVIITYYKTSTATTTYERYTEFQIDRSLNYVDTTTEIVDYENKILPQTIKKLYLSPTKRVIGGWIKSSSIIRQFYDGVPFVYTGDYSMSEIEIDNVAYELYTLTTSGTLTLKKNAKFWICGGGSGGGKGFGGSSSSYGGDGGHGGFILDGELSSGTYATTIGSGGAAGSKGGNTLISGDIEYSALGGGNTNSSNAYGGSTGGRGGYISGGSVSVQTKRTSQGISTIPFGVSSLQKHSAGGGGGGAYYVTSNNSVRTNLAGEGGSNGLSGATNSRSLATTGSSTQALGGEYGGGRGSSAGGGATSGTFYGAGGGGGQGRYSLGTTSSSSGSGAAGYQGVIYIAIQK